MRPGETNANKKTIVFKLFDADGLPCSGETDEGAVYAPAAGEVKVNRDFAGYTNVVDHTDLVHIADGDYRFTFDDTEISGSTEGVILLRVKKIGTIRTQTIVVPLRFDTDDIALDVDDVSTTLDDVADDVADIGAASAIIMGLMHRNAVIDNQTYDEDTSECLTARVRVFASEAAATAAVTGAADNADGETQRYLMTAVLDVDGKVERYQFVSDM